MSSVTTSSTTVLQSRSRPPVERFITAPTAPVEQKQTCHTCGADLSHSHLASALEDAQSRITELETQVRILTGKATAAVDKLADYEDELRQLKTSKSTSPSHPTPRPTSAAGSIPSARPHNPIPSRLSNLLTSTRRFASQPDLSTSPPPTQTTTTPNPSNPTSSTDLTQALTHERTLRLAAESRSDQLTTEIEELSAQLFAEANEMVAVERKARVKLEERVSVLEGREKGRAERLEVLEGRVGRVERVRKLLNEGEKG